MMFIPFMQDKEIVVGSIPKHYPREYAFDFKTGEMTGLIVEGIDAVKVWIYKALKTSRYTYDIYSWDYGEELEELIGKGYEKGFIDSEVERIITDTLTIHPNISRCYNFDITFKDSHLTASFTVDTDFGEVDINV